MALGCALCGTKVETALYGVPWGDGSGWKMKPLCHPCSGLPEHACVVCGEEAALTCDWIDFLETGASCAKPLCELCAKDVQFLNGAIAFWCPQHAVPHATEEA